MDKKELEELICDALENNSQWYETWDCRYRIVERRNFERVAQEVAAQILKTNKEPLEKFRAWVIRLNRDLKDPGLVRKYMDENP